LRQRGGDDDVAGVVLDGLGAAGHRVAEADGAAEEDVDAHAGRWAVDAEPARDRVEHRLKADRAVRDDRAELRGGGRSPGRVACQFGGPSIERNDRFEAGGLRYESARAFERQEMSFEGEVMLLDDPSLRDPKALFQSAPRVPVAVSWVGTAVSPVHGGEPTTPDQKTLYGPEFSRGHFNQHTRNVGTLRVGDEERAIDGFVWRDHSWGPR
jgi:hypothetical protein